MPRPYGRSFVFNDVGAWHAKPVLPELDPRRPLSKRLPAVATTAPSRSRLLGGRFHPFGWAVRPMGHRAVRSEPRRRGSGVRIHHSKLLANFPYERSLRWKPLSPSVRSDWRSLVIVREQRLMEPTTQRFVQWAEETVVEGDNVHGCLLGVSFAT